MKEDQIIDVISTEKLFNLSSIFKLLDTNKDDPIVNNIYFISKYFESLDNLNNLKNLEEIYDISINPSSSIIYRNNRLFDRKSKLEKLKFIINNPNFKFDNIYDMNNSSDIELSQFSFANHLNKINPYFKTKNTSLAQLIYLNLYAESRISNNLKHLKDTNFLVNRYKFDFENLDLIDKTNMFELNYNNNLSNDKKKLFEYYFYNDNKIILKTQLDVKLF